jgi:hypothetical protein
MKEADLVEAYHDVLVETRHLVALTQRMAIVMGAAKQDLHKLERAIHRAQDLEKEVAANAPPEGAA